MQRPYLDETSGGHDCNCKPFDCIDNGWQVSQENFEEAEEEGDNNDADNMDV